MANPIIGYAVNKLISEDHPTIDGKRCTNSKQKREFCDLCAKSCPNEAIINPAYGKADWEKCSDCGICVSACPARAISFSNTDYKKALAALSKKSQKTTIACRNSEAAADYKPYCIAALSWEMLAAIALVKEVHILKPECSQCDDRELLSIFDHTLGRVKEFLGDAKFDERVKIVSEFSESDEEVSRREAMQLLVKGFKKSVASALPEDEEDKPDSMFYRRLLNSRLKRIHKETEVPVPVTWRAPRVNSNCWGCGICAKLCPNSAIKVHTEENGDRYMLHYPSRCIECGLCYIVCLDKGINSYGPKQLKDPLKFSAAKINSASCPDCGGPVKPENAGSRCILCQIKAKKNRRWG